MTTTSVNDVKTMLTNLTATVTSKAVTQASSASFQSVLNNQTGKNTQTASAQDKATDTSSNKVSKTKDSLSDKQVDNRSDRIKNDTASDKEVEEDEQPVNADADVDTDSMEILMTAAIQIADTITETFGISDEELGNILDEMGIELTDLLDAQTLESVLLSAGQADSSLALLTDGELYQNFNEVMNQFNELMEADDGTIKAALETVNTVQDVEPTVETEVDMAQTQEIPNIVKDNEDTASSVNTVKVVEYDENGKEEALSTDDGSTLGTKEMLERAEQPKETSSDKDSNSDEKHSDDKNQTSNPILQNIFELRNDSTVANAENVTSASQGSQVDTQDIMQQIMDYMKVQVKEDMSNLEMQLHPASLGTLRIQLTSNGGAVTANFITQNEAVKAALESQMVQLKENFDAQGIKVEAIEVTVQTHQFEQNLEQNNQGREQQAGSEPQRTPRARRIQLDGILSDEELDDMEEEDRLAAEMLAANGGTVDYTA
jgi:flagellar hook-length control protein FliK